MKKAILELVGYVGFGMVVWFLIVGVFFFCKP